MLAATSFATEAFIKTFTTCALENCSMKRYFDSKELRRSTRLTRGAEEGDLARKRCLHHLRFRMPPHAVPQHFLAATKEAIAWIVKYWSAAFIIELRHHDAWNHTCNTSFRIRFAPAIRTNEVSPDACYSHPGISSHVLLVCHVIPSRPFGYDEV